MHLQMQYALFVILLYCLASDSQYIGNGSIPRELDMYSDESVKVIQFLEFCSSANLKVLIDPDYDLKKITVSFELLESKHQSCFPYFDVFLKRNQHKVASAKVPFNKETKSAFHRFENVTCGAYDVSIQPCFNLWQCAAMVINYPKKINMRSIECLGLDLHSFSLYDTHLHNGILDRKNLTICLISIFLLLVIIGSLYYHFTFRRRSRAVLGHSAVKLEDLELGDHETHFDIGDENRKIEVFMMYYHDKGTLERVENLKKCILSNCSNLSISTIEDPLEFNNFLIDPCGWLDRKLAKPRVDDVVKKIIIVDSMGKMDEEICENENETFIEAIEKLYRNFEGRRSDYANVFVVHYGCSRTNMEKMSHIVEDMRYHIPNCLKYLYQDLLTVT